MFGFFFFASVWSKIVGGAFCLFCFSPTLEGADGLEGGEVVEKRGKRLTFGVCFPPPPCSPGFQERIQPFKRGFRGLTDGANFGAPFSRPPLAIKRGKERGGGARWKGRAVPGGANEHGNLPPPGRCPPENGRNQTRAVGCPRLGFVSRVPTYLGASCVSCLRDPPPSCFAS